jgi:hypothetical protein
MVTPSRRSSGWALAEMKTYRSPGSPFLQVERWKKMSGKVSAGRCAVLLWGAPPAPAASLNGMQCGCSVQHARCCAVRCCAGHSPPPRVALAPHTQPAALVHARRHAQRDALAAAAAHKGAGGGGEGCKLPSVGRYSLSTLRPHLTPGQQSASGGCRQRGLQLTARARRLGRCRRA